MSIWRTPGLHDAMERCLADGMSAGETAGALSREFRLRVSRNAVIGRAMRTGTKLQGSPSIPTRDSLAAARARQRQAEAMRLRRALAKQEQLAKLEQVVTIEPAPIGPVHEIPAQGCRWPHGDTAGTQWRMCGHEAWRGSPYCPHHHARAFDRVSTAASARKFRRAHLAEVA